MIIGDLGKRSFILCSEVGHRRFSEETLAVAQYEEGTIGSEGAKKIARNLWGLTD